MLNPTPSPALPSKLRVFPSVHRVAAATAALPTIPKVLEMPSAAPRLVAPDADIPAAEGARIAVFLPQMSPATALAHDARNALTSIQLLAGLLAEPGVLAAEDVHYAADLQMVAGTLRGLVGQFEQLAGVANGAVQPLPKSRRSATAGDALTDCAGLLRATAGSAVAVHVSSESQLPQLALDDSTLERVLVNLVKNAREAMPNGGAVRITARRALSLSAPAVLIHVSDNGPGIPAHALEQIFQPGFSSKRQGIDNAGEPCGLGLSIVRDLVCSVGGDVVVASRRRSGTTFELRIPAVPQIC